MRSQLKREIKKMKRTKRPSKKTKTLQIIDEMIESFEYVPNAEVGVENIFIQKIDLRMVERLKRIREVYCKEHLIEKDKVLRQTRKTKKQD